MSAPSAKMPTRARCEATAFEPATAVSVDAGAGGGVDVAVVGGGITGLAAALRLAERPGRTWTLLEESERLGGKIRTERDGDFLIEGGPDCFLSSKPGGLALCRELGVEDRLIGTIPELRRSFVKRAGRLHPLPEGISGLVPSRLLPLLATSTLSVRGRLRAAGELLVPRRRASGEQPIARFVSRRFGREAYEWLVEPLLGGIYAGDGEQLSLEATFPQLARAEREEGSLLARMLLAKARSWLGSGAGMPVRSGFVTPRAGLGDLVATLAARLPARSVRTGVSVVGLEPRGSRYRLALSDGRSLECAVAILAVPAPVAARLLEPLDSRLAAELSEIPFVSTAIASVGFAPGVLGDGSGARAIDGYGYVSPRAEGGAIVACSCTTNKFQDRAAPGAVLLRFFLGRAGRDQVVAAGDEEIRALVRDELREVLKVEAEPTSWRIFRWPQALPQYNLGHCARLDRLTALLRDRPGLLLAGASYRGVGIPDCVESGWRAARRALAIVADRAASASS